MVDNKLSSLIIEAVNVKATVSSLLSALVWSLVNSSLPYNYSFYESYFIITHLNFIL